MPKLPILKGKQVLDALVSTKGGFYIHHQRGSHVRLKHTAKKNLRVTVPIHSMVYGVPCVIADCNIEAGRKVLSWLGGHDGIRCLQWNLQLPVDLEAERLLSSVESLGDGGAPAEAGDDIPDGMKDRGRWLSEYNDADDLYCPGGAVVFRNSAIESKYPGGMKSFISDFPCLITGELP